jgi:hypothetical protein
MIYVFMEVNMMIRDFSVCNGVYLGGNPTFQMNMSPPSSGSKCKPRKKLIDADGYLRHSISTLSSSEMAAVFLNCIHKCNDNTGLQK